MADDLVERRAEVIFRAGTYPFAAADGGEYTMTPEEIRRCCAAFTAPVPLTDTHHRGSVFEGRLGKVVALEPSADGRHFGGRALIPKWLHELFAGQPLRLSAVFDRLTKRLKEVALLTNPRIDGAALFTAFSAANHTETNMTKTALDTLTKLSRHVDALARDLHLGSGAAMAVYRAVAGTLRVYQPGAFASAKVEQYLGSGHWQPGNWQTTGAAMSADGAGASAADAEEEARLDAYVEKRNRENRQAGRSGGAPPALGRVAAALAE